MAKVDSRGAKATAKIDVSLAGTFMLGGDPNVHRLGFGAMRITGDGIWACRKIRTRRAARCVAPST